MPKKANWDLRRDVEKKMEKLEKRTQRAMVELMREEEERRMKE
jgi:coiled-coil domain-containing protein 12